jgi:hypothetical protein
MAIFKSKTEKITQKRGEKTLVLLSIINMFVNNGGVA